MILSLRSIVQLAAVAALAVPAVASNASSSRPCHMFPENSLRFPVETSSGIAQTGVSEKVWNQVLDAVEKTYGPVIADQGAKLELVRDWENEEVNAFADRPNEKTWIVHMFGGLARHPEMTPDGLLLVACHEVGHQIGAAPHYPGEWASSEGEADYFATLKCMRKVLAHTNNKKGFKAIADDLERDVKKRCDYFAEKSQSHDPDAKLICARSHGAADSLARTLADATNSVRKSAHQVSVPSLGTPDESRVKKTIRNDYPELQCRFDTYVNGSICAVGVDTAMDPDHPNDGVCLNNTKDKELKKKLADNSNSILDSHGARPPCWYNQAEMENYSRKGIRRD